MDPPDALHDDVGRAQTERDALVAGIGAFRLAAGTAVLVDEVIPLGSGSVAAALFDPPQRSGQLDLGPDEEVELVLSYRPTEPLPALFVTLGVEAPAFSEERERERAATLARDADVAVVVVGTTERIESEGFDRSTMALPDGQDELVRAVASANPRTVVVVNSGAPVTMPWRGDVQAILLTWFPGQEFGHALADVLLGRTEPGGRLPTTWASREEDVPVLSTQPVDGTLDYFEGLHVGYRAWLRAGAEPAYPFGHGLGYTTWSYERVSAAGSIGAGDGVDVRVRLRNSGDVAGREVVQVYLSRERSAVERPAAWLAGFAAVEAGPGREVEAVVRVLPRAFQREQPDGWSTEAGRFTLLVGSSVADIRARAEVDVRDGRAAPI